MPITAITPSLVQKNNHKNERMPVSENSQSVQRQNNKLPDMSYGLSLLSNISFKGNSSSVFMDLSKTVSAALSSLSDDGILLIGKDFKTASKNLQEASDLIKKQVINRIFFIKDDSMATTVALKRHAEVFGFDEVINLGDENLFLSKIDSLKNIRKGQSAFIENGLSITTKNPTYGFTLNLDEETGIVDLPKGLVAEFDVSDWSEEGIKKLNIKNLEALTREEEAPTAISKITFADVGGQDEAIAEIQQKILYPLKYPRFFRNNHLDGFRGALFVGPPGNGKSLTAEALANESGLPIFKINGQLLEGELVGQSAHNIENHYSAAKKAQPSIIFFDEADAIFGERTGIHKYADQSTNMHLDEISKLEKEHAQVYLIAATNHPDLIDKAALRRFNTKIEFKNLDTIERCKAVLDIHKKSLCIENFDEPEFLEKLHKADCSGTDIANITENAQLNAINRQGIFARMADGTFDDNAESKLIVTGEDFDKALEQQLAQRNMIKSYSKEFEVKGLGS